MKCPMCDCEISEKVALLQHVCDNCIETLAEIEARQDAEMQEMFNNE